MKKYTLLVVLLAFAIFGCNNSQNSSKEAVAAAETVATETAAKPKKTPPRNISELTVKILNRYQKTLTLDESQLDQIRAICKSNGERSFKSREDMNSTRQSLYQRINEEVLTASQQKTINSKRKKKG